MTFKYLLPVIVLILCNCFSSQSNAMDVDIECKNNVNISKAIKSNTGRTIKFVKQVRCILADKIFIHEYSKPRQIDKNICESYKRTFMKGEDLNVLESIRVFNVFKDNCPTQLIDYISLKYLYLENELKLFSDVVALLYSLEKGENKGYESLNFFDRYFSSKLNTFLNGMIVCEQNLECWKITSIFKNKKGYVVTIDMHKKTWLININYIDGSLSLIAVPGLRSN